MDATNDSATAGPGESGQTSAQSQKVTLAALVAGAGKDKNRIVIEDSAGNPVGLTMVFEDFDGKTKLRYDAKIDASLGLRPNKRTASKNESLAWLFNLKCRDIEVDATIDLEGISGTVELKQFFLTNESAIIWMRTAVYEYIDRNRVTTEDAKN